MHLTELDIIRYAEALTERRTEALPASVLDHCEECLECKREVLQLASVIREIDKKTAASKKVAGQIFPAKSYVAYFKAASVVILLFLPLYLIFSSINALSGTGKTGQFAVKNGSGTSTGVGSDRSNGKQHLISSGKVHEYSVYDPLPQYEPLCGEVYRSENAEIISPVNGIVSDGRIKFRAKFSNSGSRFLKVYNNRDILVYSVTLDTTEFETSKDFQKGLFYWKIETERDLIYLGKFTVR